LGGGGLNQIRNKFDWVEGSHPLHPIKFIGETLHPIKFISESDMLFPIER